MSVRRFYFYIENGWERFVRTCNEDSSSAINMDISTLHRNFIKHINHFRYRYELNTKMVTNCRLRTNFELHCITSERMMM